MNNPVLFAGKEIGLELLADVCNCNFMCRGRNAGKNFRGNGPFGTGKVQIFRNK